MANGLLFHSLQFTSLAAIETSKETYMQMPFSDAECQISQQELNPRPADHP